MAYMTPRKRALGLGAAGGGTEHHWRVYVTSVVLILLVPLFVFTFGSVLGGTYEEVVVALSHPFRALVIGLALIVGLYHFRLGSQAMIEDYTGGTLRKALIIAMIALTYAVLAVALFAVARLAL
jgi:succinate dehydrogenase / fumarate reductase, membrane anchor subunit